MNKIAIIEPSTQSINQEPIKIPRSLLRTPPLPYRTLRIKLFDLSI